MANNYTKTMRQALQEARSFRDVQEGFSTAQIKMAYGVLNDPRYKQGNYDGAVKAIEKIAKGLSDHPDVKNALKRANEELLDLPATGDTTTSNASQEVEQVDEARFSTAQIDALKKAYAPLKGKDSYKSATGSKMNFNKLKNKMSSYSPSHLLQLSTADIPMVSDAAKELLAKKDKRFSEEVVEGGPPVDGGPGSGGHNKKGAGSSGDGRGDYKKSSKAALALGKYKSKYRHLKNNPLKIPGASKHMPADKSKRVSMKKTPKKFGGDYYDQEDREELAHRVKFHHLGGKSFAGKPPAWQLKKYGITDDGKLKAGWKPDDQLKEQTELDEASRLRPTKGLYSMAQMKQQVARTEKAFNEFEQHCNFIFQMDRDVGPSMSDNSGKYFDVHRALDNANKEIKKALADAKKIT